MKNRSIPNAIAINFPGCGVLGMKTRRRELAANNANFRGKMSVYRGHPSGGRHFVKRYVHMRHLSQGMNSRVRSPCPVQFNGGRNDLKESALQMILN
jgi:hypothetical protein